MPILSRRAARYVRTWMTDRAEVVEREVLLDRGDRPVPATVLSSARPRGRQAAWVVLHGMTRPGRAHLQLVRFTRALTSTGAIVIVPEIPEWRDLHLAPHLAAPTVAASIRGLRERPWSIDHPVGVIGFSFGAPHAIATAADPELAPDIGAVVGFGGYCDVDATFRFMMTGEVEGREPVLPDPYGRWIVAANYLDHVPELADHGNVSRALRSLATYSGDLGKPAWDPAYDRKIEALRSGLDAADRALFDLFAPVAGAQTDTDAAAEVGHKLAEAGLRIDPLLDPREALGRVRRPVHVVHGRGDQLIPFTEADKLGAALPADTWSRVTVTRLFAHSTWDRFPLLRSLLELPRFARALSGVLDSA